MRTRINRVQCKLCEDIIQSEGPSDYVSCNCGAVAVGGRHKKYGKRHQMEDMSYYTEGEDDNEEE